MKKIKVLIKKLLRQKDQGKKRNQWVSCKKISMKTCNTINPYKMLNTAPIYNANTEQTNAKEEERRSHNLMKNPRNCFLK